ncbi:hypothetical protein E1A91_D03G167500v1 [Gossypium mustelinum]|uniref:Uncharacterized protein n=1 Tax=Gossypium mustelinum TaxID=34275 RepID=A0A5D2VP12_GOSMU|nr:hypothetical protein E1A91_D03G167500v1 [Gossypium mustelinum]
MTFSGVYFCKHYKHDGPVRISSLSHVGLERIKPVILPLLREGGLRCSVKPASRSTLNFRNHETQSFHSSPSVQLLAWNGQARFGPTPDPILQASPMFHHLKAPTQVTSKRYQARRSECRTSGCI